MSAAPVIKRIKLPLKTWAQLKRKARRQNCSISSVVAAAVVQDLENEAGAHPPQGRRGR